MSVVLVHGNPETAAVWSPLVAALGRDDVARLSPPGFGAPIPDQWGATVEEYRQWLIDELEALGSPVDLVGHDWGGLHAILVAMTRPDLLRSWATDAIGVFDPDYVWHDLAQTWQTPGAGEEAVAMMATAPPHQRAAQLTSLGLTAEIAEQLVAAYNDTMGRCILALYRSAGQPVMAKLGRTLPAAAQPPPRRARHRGPLRRDRPDASPRSGTSGRPDRGARGPRSLVDGSRPRARCRCAHPILGLASRLMTRSLDDRAGRQDQCPLSSSAHASAVTGSCRGTRVGNHYRKRHRRLWCRAKGPVHAVQ